MTAGIEAAVAMRARRQTGYGRDDDWRMIGPGPYRIGYEYSRRELAVQLDATSRVA